MTKRNYLPAVREATETAETAGPGGAIELANSTGAPVTSYKPEESPAAVYLRSLAPGSRPTMHSALRTILGLLGAETDIWGFPWERLRFAHTSAVRAALAERYTPAQANKALSALRGVLKAAWRLGLMEDGDYLRAVDVGAVKGQSAPVGRALESDEIELLLKACAADPGPAGLRDAAILAVGYGCGLRRGELAALDLADWDAREAALTVQRGKGNKARVVYLNSGGAAEVAEWIKVRGRREGALFQPINKGGRILRQRRLSGPAVGDIVSRRAEQAGLEPLRAHDLRRSFCSSLLDAGVDLTTVQAMAGHSSPVVTSRYDRRRARVQREAAERLCWPRAERSGSGSLD
jgi:integrase